nr:MlaD family protein [uncultured Flavobacterium sp.]
MEKTDAQKIRLGIFVLTGLLLFIAAVYFIGKKQNLFGKTVHLSSVFNNVNGLQMGNNVRYSGINAGTVKDIEMINDTTIRVDMIIDDKVLPHIKKDAIATISSDGLVGNMIVNIIPGTGNAPTVEPGDTLPSFGRVRTEEIMKTLNAAGENAAEVISNLTRITQEIKSGKGTIGALLNDTVMAYDMKESMRALKITSQGTNESVKALNQLLSSLNQKDNVIGVINDSAVANKLRKTMTNLEKSGEKINGIVDNLNATITNAKDGKGAINYLSNDPKLVGKIDSTMTNINQASKKLNQTMDALKSNFLFRGFFKKKEKQEQKTKNQTGK